jgi:hypothetical protein
MNYPFRYGINSVLLNDNGTRFQNAEFILGVEPRLQNRTAKPWFTLACGQPAGDFASESLIKKVCGDRKDEIVIWGSLGSRSAVLFDVDSDGDLDIVTNEFGDVPQVLISDLAQTHHPEYLKIRLQGTKSNRQGIGATVTVIAGSRRLSRWFDGKTGYLSQGIPELYVGLGDAPQVDSIEVLWPSGTKQTVQGPIATRQTVVVTEPLE